MTVDADFQKLLNSVSSAELIKIVETISFPRYSKFNAQNNKRAAERIFSQLASFGYQTHFQGPHANVVALPPAADSSSLLLVGAHYDSVPGCPGADDNASAIAALLISAKVLAEISPAPPVCFVAFNAEEDGLVGSSDFVRSYLPDAGLTISEAHILEMVGYATDEPDTQKLPPGLPLEAPGVGNFLAVMGNSDSGNLVEDVLSAGKTYLPEFPLFGLKLFPGLENLAPDLVRSDHLPFWQKKIPALMWTDTADFRNPHYHRSSDTPGTLNYSFLKRVTQLLLLQILNRKA